MNGQQSELEFTSLKERIIGMLTIQLSETLTYHGVHHTIDVLEQCERIASAEGITNEKDLLLLKIAALYHDIGFLFVYRDHEQKSCEILEKQMKDVLSAEELRTICSLIMATRIPQSPKTKLEEVICDADLDYLGRDDFESISNKLKKEFFSFEFVKNLEDWNEVQIKFIEGHEYFTKTSQQTRTKKKIKNLEALKLRAAAIMSNK